MILQKGKRVASSEKLIFTAVSLKSKSSKALPKAQRNDFKRFCKDFGGR